ncbi:hypothetical protein WJX72_001622 [[Myrmecia] bisecta]|uniref:Uncharacterized protein n=1 Tax=[Myrmecia] bisecta TaxID=41462 RepID=A0AAW1Q757_9CHLO
MAVVLANSATVQIDIRAQPYRSSTCSDAATDALPLTSADAAVQAGVYSSSAVQTEERGKTYLQAAKGGTDWQHLAAFLNRVVPQLEACLDENLISTAFAARELGDDGAAVPAECAYVLQPLLQPFANSAIQQSPLCCTSVSWNATGNTLAASLGRFDIEGWCSQPGALCMWHLNSTDAQPAQPSLRLDTDSCLQCCAFHPHHPGLIAGGTFNGELLVWDLGREGDALLGKSGLSDASHQEPITQVAWQHSTQLAARHVGQTEAYQLVTLGADGRILIWLWQRPETPVFGYQLVYRRLESHMATQWGGVSLAFPDQQHQASSMCVVGTEGGAVLNCVLDYTDAAAKEFAEAVAAQQALSWPSPVRSDYAAHIGPVHGVHCCAGQPSLFLSSGADGQLRLFSVLRRKPVAEFAPSKMPLFSAQWSPARPLVFAVGAGDGRVYLYDLLQSTMQPADIIDVCGKAASVRVLAFNVRQPDLLATSDGAHVKVWRLGSRYSTLHGPEERLAKQLADLGEGNIHQLLQS